MVSELSVVGNILPSASALSVTPFFETRQLYLLVGKLLMPTEVPCFPWDTYRIEVLDQKDYG